MKGIWPDLVKQKIADVVRRQSEEDDRLSKERDRLLREARLRRVVVCV